MKNFTINIWNSQNTVFTINELSTIIEHSSDTSLRLKISNYTKKWYLKRLHRWIYSIPNKKINILEFANKIYSPSYISFFTALYHYGIIFQANPTEIDIAYKKSQVVKRDSVWINIRLRCLKEDILLNNKWLIIKETYTIASKERAFLDTIYLYKNIHFDNIDSLDLKKLVDLIPIYKKNIMKSRIIKYFPNLDLWML